MSGPLRHIALGARAAFSRPGLVSIYGGLDLLTTVVMVLPGLLAATLLFRTLVDVLPFAVLTFSFGLVGDALIARATSWSFLAPTVGLLVSGALLAGVLRVFFLSGALGVLSADILGGAKRSEFMDNALARFPAGLEAVGLIVLLGILWAGWSAGVLFGGGAVLSAGISDPRSTGFVGAAAISFGLAALIVSAAGFELLTRVILIRVFVSGDSPAVATWEALTLIGRRLGAALVIMGVFIVAQLAVALVVSTLNLPIAVISSGSSVTGFAIGARVAVYLIRTLAAAALALCAYAAFTALVLDEDGRLPEPDPAPSPGGPHPGSGEQFVIARPVEPVATAVPIIPARPIEDST